MLLAVFLADFLVSGTQSASGFLIHTTTSFLCVDSYELYGVRKQVCRGPLASFLPWFSMPTTTTHILGMNTVLKTHTVGPYQVHITVLRYISTPSAAPQQEVFLFCLFSYVCFLILVGVFASPLANFLATCLQNPPAGF